MSEPAARLHNKTLVMIVGPTAIGKSTIMKEVVRIDSNFSYARTFTTRERRPGEMSSYRHISDAQARQIRDSGQAFTFLEHPTTGLIYGTDCESFSNRYTLLDTLSYSVEQYRALPFMRTVTISITASPEDWRSWLLERFPEPSTERDKRLLEAKQSIEWSLSQTSDHHWVVNHEGSLPAIAKQIIAIAKGDEKTTDIPSSAQSLMDVIADLLSYE